MKTKLFAALVIMLGFTMGVAAQSQSSTSSIVGHASISGVVAISGTTPLDFKNVTQGVPKTIDFVNVVTAGTATGLESTGKFSIVKGLNTQVTIAFTALPTDLVGPLVTDLLPIVYTAQLSKTGTTAHPIATPAEGNNVVVANADTTAPYFATDQFQLDLGGTVSPKVGQAAGSYTANITLTATYN